MKEFFHLGPGSEVPGWLEDLDRRCFGEPWGALAGHEEAWGAVGECFALWAIGDTIQEAELLRIAVEPELRARGHGHELMKTCEGQLSRLGIRTLLLEVRVSNTPARQLYDASGWRQDGLRKAYYKDGEDAALYRKELG